jgi:hypothetical protein
LIVHPEIAGLDEAKILCRLKQKLAQGSRDHRFMAQLWQDAEAFRLRREIPYASPRGKILPLHIQRRGHSQ